MTSPLFYAYLLLTTVCGLAHSVFDIRHSADLCNLYKIGYIVVDSFSAPVLWPVMLTRDLLKTRVKLIKTS